MEGTLNKQKLFHANLRMYLDEHILLFINTRFREHAMRACRHSVCSGL